MTTQTREKKDGEPPILTQILKKRRSDCEALADTVVFAIVEALWKQHVSESSQHIRSPKEQFLHLLEDSLKVAGNENVTPVSKRRSAYNLAMHLLEELDAKVLQRFAGTDSPLPEMLSNQPAEVPEPAPQRRIPIDKQPEKPGDKTASKQSQSNHNRCEIS
jgi:hypothetical protein